MDDFTAILNEAPWEKPHTLTLDERDPSIVAILDREDYLWAVRWAWTWQFDKRGKKRYAFRNKTTSSGGVRSQVKCYLHKEIVRRAYGDPPDEYHTMGDHKNADSLDNRRENLEWATPSMNRRSSRGPNPPRRRKR